MKKFEKSILAQIGWSEEDYIKVVCNMVQLKIINNIPLTPTESWIYINKEDLKKEEDIKEIKNGTTNKKKRRN